MNCTGEHTQSYAHTHIHTHKHTYLYARIHSDTEKDGQSVRNLLKTEKRKRDRRITHTLINLSLYPEVVSKLMILL